MVAPGLIPALLFAAAVVGALALARAPVRPHTLSGLVVVAVAATQADVYALLTDLSRFPDWFGSVTAAAVLPPSGGGEGGDHAVAKEGAAAAAAAAGPADAAGAAGAAGAADPESAPLAAAARGEADAPAGHGSGDRGGAAAPPADRLAAGTRFRLSITEAGAVEHHTAEVTAAAPPSRLALRSHGSDADGSGKVVYVFNLVERAAPAGTAAEGQAPPVQTTVHCAFDVEMPCSAAVGALLPLVRGLARWQLRGYLTKFKALAEAGVAAAAEGVPAGATRGGAAAGTAAVGGGVADVAAAADVAGSEAADAAGAAVATAAD